jgi:general secretion pathway protein D
VLLLSLLVLGGCTGLQPAGEPPEKPVRSFPLQSTTRVDAQSAARRDAGATTPAAGAAADNSRIHKGTGTFVKGGATVAPPAPGSPTAPAPAPAAAARAGDGVSLNFEGADLREVVRSILGDNLNRTYVIDPAVSGTVTIRTASPIPRDALLPTLETLLRMNGHTLVQEAGIFKIVPAAAAVRGNVTPQLGNLSRPLPGGFSVQIVPLRYVGVRDMLRLLEPFAKDAATIRIDDLRNLLILSGTEREIRHLMETVDMFDVDWMSGMSAGLFQLQSADVKQVMQELNVVIGDRNQGPFAGILRVVPIERLNAVLVITPQPKYLDDAKKWIERLDQGGAGTGQRLYVYQVRNGRADKLAPLLTQAFGGRVTTTTTPEPQLAPGQAPAFVGTTIGVPTFQPATGLVGLQQTPVTTLPAQGAVQPVTVQPQVQPQQVQPPGVTAPGVAGQPAQAAALAGVAGAAGAAAAARMLGSGAAPTSADGSVGIARGVQIVADKDNNMLLIVATPGEYAIIEAALAKLDVAPRQVMIEVTMVEVLLKDEFKFGVEWYFTAGLNVRGNLTSAALPSSASNLFATDVATSALNTRRGFNIAWQNLTFPGGIQAVVNLLATNSKTKIISNPHIIATDNQKASIKVGDKIPIDVQNVLPGVGNVVTTTSQYLDTGILVTVTPKINAGGLITMDLAAEVSDPGVRLNNQAPPINTRSAQTLVTVQSGETMVLAGLIRENRAGSTDGIPFLSEIPILGSLFGTQTYDGNRTELVMFITPRMVSSDADMRSVAEEIRRKMERLGDSFPPSLEMRAAPPVPGTRQ